MQPSCGDTWKYERDSKDQLFCKINKKLHPDKLASNPHPDWLPETQRHYHDASYRRRLNMTGSLIHDAMPVTGVKFSLEWPHLYCWNRYVDVVLWNNNNDKSCGINFLKDFQDHLISTCLFRSLFNSSSPNDAYMRQ